MTNIVTTRRLTLDLPAPEAASALSDAYREIADNVFWQMPALLTPQGAGDVIAAWQLAHTIPKNERFFILRHEGQIIGSAGLQPADGEDRHYTLTYWVRSSAQGKGFATEAANALTRYAFATLKAQSVSIAYERNNIASRRVIAKLGFTRYAQEIKADGSTAEIYRRTDIKGLPIQD